jgi:hypothetical protein
MSKPTELSKEELQAFQKVASNDLVDFSIYTDRNYNPTWLHEEIAKQLTRVEKGEVKRLMIFVPPRHGKSELGSIKFPAWYLGRHPEKEVITSSYSAELAQDFGYKTRNLVATQEYQQIFDTKLRDDSKSKAKWLTGEGGGYTATGVGGAITGRGADLAIIDDPFKNREEAESKTIRDKVYNWYTSTLYTRLEKGGAIILILTRWHQDDLAGRLLKAMGDGGEQWEVIKFPALATQDEAHRKQGEPLWVDKYDLGALENIKKTIGVYDWSALYQQTPTNSDTQEFKQEFWKYRTMEEVLALTTYRTLTIDTAISQKASADYTGLCANFTDRENKWNLKSWKEKISPLELIDLLFNLQEQYRFDSIGIEKTIYLQAIKPFLDEEMRRRNRFLPIVELQHNGVQKEIRIRALLPRYESKSIYHITGQCTDLEEDQLSFPKGIHDDVLDATAYQIQIARASATEQRPTYNLNRHSLR